MKQELFRREVIDASRDRLAGTVVAAVPPSSRLYTWLVLGFAAIGIAFLVFGSYATSAQVRGIVAYDAGIARVYPSAPAEIRQIHVRNGEVVPAGAPLVTLSLAQGVGGIGTQLDQLAHQDEELARQVELASAIGSTESNTLQQQRSGLAATVASLERQKRIAAGQIQLAEVATRRAVELAREGAGTQRQVEDSRSSLLARRAELESLNERLIGQREALRTIQSQIAQQGLEASRSRSMLLAQRAALARQDRLVLTAPVAGIVGDIAARIGLRAPPESSLATIVPEGSRLEVQLYAPSSAIGFVQPGQEVRLLFDAFPYQKYGAGRGTVTFVSDVITEPGALDPGLGISEPVFRIRVAIDPRGLSGAAAERPLRAGMTLSANLVLQRRSLWEVFLDPVLRAIRG